MDRAATFRRIFHLASPAFLAYYALPDPVSPGLPKLALAVLFLGTASCVEIARIALGVKLFGLRPYEGERVSAYAQGMLGLAFGIFVIQDPRIVVPVFLGMAWVDPLAAACRRRGITRILPAATYLGLFLAATTAMGAFTLSVRLLLSAVAMGLSILVEGPKVPQVDDDLLMQVIPYVVLGLLVALLAPGPYPGSF